jgi:hypothetical protein
MVNCGGMEYVCVSFGSGRDAGVIYTFLGYQVLGAFASLLESPPLRALLQDGEYTLAGGEQSRC